MTEHSANGNTEEKVLGVSEDPVLRPVGTLMVMVGSIWAVFAGMALEAGSYGQPLAALALVALGMMVAGLGRDSEQI